MVRSRHPAVPLIAVALLLVMDFSMGASALVTTPGITDKEADAEVRPDLNHPPPLMCGEHECPPKDRSPGFPSGDAGWPVEDPGWWFHYWYDLDSDGMDDRLQRIIAGERESVSTTSITGADGLATVAIVVDYSWQPGPTSILAIKEALHEHGWSEEGSWFDVLHILDSIVIDHVPVSSLIDIWNLEGVVMIEEQNVLVPLLDNAPRGSKVRDSDIFDETMRDFGYDGSGVVIAILDTGVDNEHFSLDDFSDNNNDNEKEPDELADPKWVGGCDATSWNSQDCDDGNIDPDDGDGHGTHVAGIALGTGDERRINQGYAPGSYLVDVKVMSDAGATNSAATLRGIQWVIDNVDHDWGNNESSEGIDVMSMSFGSGSDPQGDDPGDNGTNAEARAVDEAADAGIVPVAAIGNDGRRRITSVGAADSAITVGAIDDENTIERGDDMIESYSNSGPREDDGDENEWEELKPTVVAPGSNIMSAQHAASSSSIPGAPRPLAEDSYTQMTGTSMSAPAVAGFVAVMLQIDDSVDPQEVKDLLQNNSERRGSASQPSITDKWNNQYGFGIVDGKMILEAMLGGGVDPPDPGNGTEPPPAGSGDWVVIENPKEESWLIEGETYSARGHIDEDAETNGTIEEVAVRISYTHRPEGEPKREVILLDWHTAQGTTNWSAPFTLPEFTEDEINILEVSIEAQARNQFDQWSDVVEQKHEVGLVEVTMGGPSGQDTVTGSINVYGTWESVNGGTVQWRLGTNSWETAQTFGGSGSGNGDWSVTWNTEEVDDGFYRLSVRIISGDGVHSEEIRRTVEVDNDPPAPDLIFRTGLSVEEYGIPLSETYVNTFLEVRCEIRNDGDLAASNLAISLYEDGARKDELVLPSIDSGDIVEIVLYWNPTTVGNKVIMVSLDPADTIEENDETDNEQSLTFPVIQRPQGIDLAFREGAVRTEPTIPHPDEQFLITARVDNLGSSDATGVEAMLEIMTERGWELVSSTAISLVVGQGASQISFAHRENESGPLEIRITLSGSALADLDWTNNQVEATILVDESTLSGARSMSFESGEMPIEVIDLDDEGLVITEKNGQLGLYRLNSNLGITACTNVLDDMWSGDIAIWSNEDGVAHVVWTRRFLDSSGYFQQTLSYSTIDATCQITPIQDLLEPILLSDGKYWGIDIDVEDSEVLVAGYHRDLFTGGTYEDLTSVFLLHADAPTKSSDWELTPHVVSEIDLIPGTADPVDVEIGDDDGAHLLYQSIRSDSTGIERLGLWYAHGLVEQASWTFKKAIGDEASLGCMKVLIVDDEERIVAAWREGEEHEAELVAIVSDSSFEAIDNLSRRYPARGISTIDMIEVERGVQLFFDMVGPTGPQVQYGIIDAEDGWLGISNRLNLGFLYLVDRSPASSETVIIHTSASGWQIRALIDDNDPNNGDGSLLDQVRHALGLDDQNFNILLGGFAITILLLCAIVLTTLSARAVRWMRGRRRTEASGSVLLEEDVVDVIDEDDIAVTTSEADDAQIVELVDINEGAGERRERRELRSSVATAPEALPPLPAPETSTAHEALPEGAPAPSELPPLNRPVMCPSCSSRFEAPAGVKTTKCPVCDERIAF